MKRMIKAAAMLLCLCTLLGFTACKQVQNGDAPEGMMLASAAGADFRLYVPTTWNLNTAYGVSGACYNLSTQSTVSVVKYPITEAMQGELDALCATVPAEQLGEARIDWFFTNQCKPILEAQSLGGSFSEVQTKTAGLLDTANAWRYHYRGVVNQKSLQFVQIVAERDAAFYVFAFTVEDRNDGKSESSLYQMLIGHVESMLEHFVFAEPYEPDDYAKDLADDVAAPNGMRIASGDEVAYRFFVPADWIVDREQRIFAAYVASDLSSVSVVPYGIESMNVEQFFDGCRAQMIATAGEDGYAQLAEPATMQIGGCDATVYTYRYRIGGRDFYYQQAVVYYKGMVYSITYTAASEALFALHKGEVDAILAAFQFR